MLEKLITVQTLLEDIYAQQQPPETEGSKATQWGRLCNCEKDTESWPLKVGSVLSIGKARKCSVSIPDPSLSNIIAKVVVTENEVVIEGKTKKVPLQINSVPLLFGEKRSLQDQDLIMVNGVAKIWTFVCFIFPLFFFQLGK